MIAASFSFCSNSQKLMILMMIIMEDDLSGSIKTFVSTWSTRLHRYYGESCVFCVLNCRFNQNFIYDQCEVSLDGVQDPTVFM